MLVRRFGSKILSVEPQFNARAMTEVGFLRTSDVSLTAEELEAEYERAGERELTASTQGDVKSAVEHELLEQLEAQLRALDAELGADGLVLIENEAGRDYPKTRDRTTNTVVAGENRLHFSYEVDPPLKLTLYRKR